MKVIHMIPKDGLGGAEQAARSLDPSPDLNIETVFICGDLLSDKKHIKVLGKKVKLNSFGFYYSGFRYLLEKKPDVLICSLWRTSFIGVFYFILMKVLLKKDFKLVLFLHSSKFSHFLDKAITKCAAFFASEIWCDSHATEVAFFTDKHKHKNEKVKIISFFVRIDKQENIQNTNKVNNFVFWGRIAKAKRLDRSITFFGEILHKCPESLFYIYGPDGGELKYLESLVKELGLSHNVLFMGEKMPDFYPEEAFRSKFFINTSSHEGMAIAVVEAMQLALVPVITPVGEIANYCIDNFNSIYFNDKTADKLMELMKDNDLYSKISGNAREYWANKVDYSTDFNNNCLRLLNKN